MDREMEIYKILCKQEETLRFDSFDNTDAWELGCLIVNEARSRGLSIAVDIVINGYKVFRYGFPGTNDYNEIWLSRKIKSVTMMHRSTLSIHYMRKTGQEDIYEGGHLEPAEYAAMGGGFPIYVNGVGVIGVLAVSGLEHHEDHDMAVTGLCKYLGKEVERVHAE